jgi:hypothetical protein
VKVCHIWLYVLKDVPEPSMLLARELGFRPAKKSANWHRFYDNRIRGVVDERLAAERFAEANSIALDIRPVRSTKPRRPGKSTIPSAAAWLNRHDPRLRRKRRFGATAP